MVELMADENPDIRYAIAEDPLVPVHLLIYLAGDENPYVAARAQKTIRYRQQTLRQQTNRQQTNKQYNKKGEKPMPATTIERTLRRMLSTKERLSKGDALRLKEMILADGYLSKSERKIMVRAIENDLLDDSAFEIFLEMLLQKIERRRDRLARAAGDAGLSGYGPADTTAARAVSSSGPSNDAQTGLSGASAIA